MALTETSRYLLGNLILDDNNFLFTDLRERISHDDIEDVITHIVVEGDTLQNLALRFYGSEFGGATLWWAIADFQPEPINDPTVRLTPGSVLLIPPLNVIQDELLGLPDDTSEAL